MSLSSPSDDISAAESASSTTDRCLEVGVAVEEEEFCFLRLLSHCLARVYASLTERLLEPAMAILELSPLELTPRGSIFSGGSHCLEKEKR